MLMLRRNSKRVKKDLNEVEKGPKANINGVESYLRGRTDSVERKVDTCVELSYMHMQATARIKKSLRNYVRQIEGCKDY